MKKFYPNSSHLEIQCIFYISYYFFKISSKINIKYKQKEVNQIIESEKIIFKFLKKLFFLHIRIGK